MAAADISWEHYCHSPPPDSHTTFFFDIFDGRHSWATQSGYSPRRRRRQIMQLPSILPPTLPCNATFFPRWQNLAPPSSPLKGLQPHSFSPKVLHRFDTQKNLVPVAAKGFLWPTCRQRKGEEKVFWAHLDFRTGSLVTGKVEIPQFDGGQLSEISISLSDRKRNGRHLFLFFFLFSFDEMGRIVSRGKMLTGRHLKAGLHCENVGIREKIKTKVSPNVCKNKTRQKNLFISKAPFFVRSKSHWE